MIYMFTQWKINVSFMMIYVSYIYVLIKTKTVTLLLIKFDLKFQHFSTIYNRFLVEGRWKRVGVIGFLSDPQIFEWRSADS